MLGSISYKPSISRVLRPWLTRRRALAAVAGRQLRVPAAPAPLRGDSARRGAPEREAFVALEGGGELFGGPHGRGEAKRRKTWGPWLCPCWFCWKNGGRCLVYLVVSSSTRAIYLDTYGGDMSHVLKTRVDEG